MTNVETPETPIPHAEAARQLLENLRTMQATIDGFGIPPAPLDRQSRPRGHRLLPDGMFASLAVALEASQQFAAATDLMPGEIRDMLRYGEAYLPVADELERFARGIRYLVGMRRAKVGRKASSAYRVGQAMNLLADDALLVPEVESMKRAIKDRRRRKDSTTPSGSDPQSSGSP
jgi:hypothetical protein